MTGLTSHQNIGLVTILSGFGSFSLTKHFDPIVRMFICLLGFIYGSLGLEHTLGTALDHRGTHMGCGYVTLICIRFYPVGGVLI